MKIQEVTKRSVTHERGRPFRPQKSKIYISVSGESVIQNLMNRRQRPYTSYKKELMPEILEKCNLPKDTKVSWSQKAGCACGCSPGFIIQDGPWGNMFFVSVTE